VEVSPFSIFIFVNSFNILSIFSLVFVLLVFRLKPGFNSWVFIKGISIGACLGLIESIHFNVNPDLTISLDDGAPKKVLTLKINTTEYQMIEGSRPLALVYRIYYKLLKTNLNPQALLKDPKDKTLLLQASSEDIQVNIPKMIKWEDIKLPDE
jgi:hypothetical protein